MTAFFVTASLLIVFLILDRIQKMLNRQRELRNDENAARLEVLKIVAKEELYRFQDAEAISSWITRLLQMLGYENVKSELFEEDSAFDYTCTRGNQTVYVACKLWNVKKFDADVTCAAVQKLVGAMVGGRTRKGLIITAGSITDEARQYLESLPVRYSIDVLDGAALINKLHELRRIKLQPLVEI